MAFDWSLNLLPRDTAADFDLVQLARDSFVAMAGRQEQWPSGIKFLCVHCDASSMMAADDAQEALIPVRQASPPAAPQWATEAAALRAKGPRWRAATARYWPGCRGYYCSAAAEARSWTAAALRARALLDDAGEGGAMASRELE